MRRSITPMLVALVALSTPLVAQTDTALARAPGPAPNAIGLGFVATLGPEWQIEGGDLAFVRRFSRGPLGALSVGIRLGTFIDEGAILGGSRGFVFAGALAARSSTASIAQLGDDENANVIGFDVSVEASGYLTSSSPLPHGARWLAVALLPGLRVGSGAGMRYGFVIGPTAFIGGGKSTVRGLLSFRLEVPLARGERRP